MNHESQVVNSNPQKWHDEFGKFWPKYSTVSKICTLIGFYCANCLFDIKKCKGVIFHDTEEWCKSWRKTDMWFAKWHEEFGKFLPEHAKVSKLGPWWGLFVQSRMENDTKMEEDLTCCFEIDIRSLKNFDRGTRKSPKFAL